MSNLILDVPGHPGGNVQMKGGGYEFLEDVSIAHSDVVRHVRGHKLVAIVSRDMDISNRPLRVGFLQPIIDFFGGQLDHPS